jgi:Tol biopolymer transport system component
VAFVSSASNLVSGFVSTGAASSIYLWERASNTVRLASHVPLSTVTPGNGESFDPRLSADGAFVAFTSNAGNLAVGQNDVNGGRDVFRYERAFGNVDLVSRKGGAPVSVHGPGRPAIPTDTGNGPSYYPAISADGAFVGFTTEGSDLALPTADTNGGRDVFSWEKATQTGTPLSFGPAVTSLTGNGFSQVTLHAMSADGRFAVFQSRAADLTPGDANTKDDIFVVDRATGTRTLVSRSAASGNPANNDSGVGTISADGAWIAYQSLATDVVAGQPALANGRNIYLFDRAADTSTLVSHLPGSPTGTAHGDSQQATLSADGHFIVFVSAAPDLVAGQTDTNPGQDVFLFERATGTVTLVSHAAGAPTTAADRISSLPAISADGRWVAYISLARNLVAGQVDADLPTTGYDVFLWDRLSGANTLVSHADGAPATATNIDDPFRAWPALSRDGRFVAFVSPAPNLVPGQVDAAASYDAFVFDREMGNITLASGVGASASVAGGDVDRYVALDGSGRWVAFGSRAANLVAGQSDTNGAADVFLFDRIAGTTTLVSHTATALTAADSGGNTGAFRPLVSDNGDTVTYQSRAATLAPGQVDQPGSNDLFLYERRSGRNRLLSHAAASPRQAANGPTTTNWDLSADGRTVVFGSFASDLAAGDFNMDNDVFSWQRPGADLFTLTPCRLLDTRRPEDGPALASGAVEVLNPSVACGVPATASAVAVNVTVVDATGQGNLTFFPADLLQAPLASVLNFLPGVTRANNAVLALSEDGLATLAVRPTVAGGGTVHVIVDVTGFFQ